MKTYSACFQAGDRERFYTLAITAPSIQKAHQLAHDREITEGDRLQSVTRVRVWRSDDD